MSSTLVSLPLDKLHALRRNPQYLTEKQQRALEESIRRDGFLVPIIVRRHKKIPETYEILSGNHRCIASRNVGLAEIPCVFLDPCSDDQAARIAVNMNTVHGDPNVELLAPFLAEMSDAALGQLYIAEEMIQEIRSFDTILKDRLDSLQIPDAINKASHPDTIPNCKCSKCGARHVAARNPSSSTSARPKSTRGSKRS
jgi:ParB/RepB/Spo0J family partition protein